MLLCNIYIIYMQLEDVSETCLLTARWHLLTSNMAAVYTVLSEEQIKVVADFIVKCMVTCEAQPSK